MTNVVNNAIESAIAKEAKKLVDIKGLAEKVAKQVTKDVESRIKKGGFLNLDALTDAIGDNIDYWKISQAVSKAVSDKLDKAAKKI